MKIVFLGSSASSLYCLKFLVASPHQVVLVITQPDRPSGRGKRITPPPVKEYALENNIPVLQSHRIRKDQIVLDKLKHLHSDLNVVVAYGQIIPASLIYLPKYNTINLHFSLLPKYRGASPVQWALFQGEKITGVTIFELDEKMDEGPILSARETPIHPEENAFELGQRLTVLGSTLLLETVSHISQLQPQPQDHSQATYAPLIKKEDGKINWDKDASLLGRQIRAFFPWPSTYAFWGEKRIKIIQGHWEPEKTSPSATPGEILAVQPSGIDVSCGQASVFIITTLQPENKKPMSAHAFSLGANLQPGHKFT